MLERVERTPLHAVIDSLTTPQPLAIDEYLRCDFNSLQVWDHAEQTLIALYLPNKHLSYACYFLVVSQFFEKVCTHFPRFFGNKLASTIQFMQAYGPATMQLQLCAIIFCKPKTSPISIRKMRFALFLVLFIQWNCVKSSTQLSKNPNFLQWIFGDADTDSVRSGMITAPQQAVGSITQAPRIALTSGGRRATSRITTQGSTTWLRTLRAAAERMIATKRDDVSVAEAWMIRRSFPL